METQKSPSWTISLISHHVTPSATRGPSLPENHLEGLGVTVISADQQGQASGPSLFPNLSPL